MSKYRIVTDRCDHCRKFESQKVLEVELSVEEARLLQKIHKKVGIESISCEIKPSGKRS